LAGGIYAFSTACVCVSDTCLQISFLSGSKSVGYHTWHVCVLNGAEMIPRAGVWQSSISERFACMRSRVQFLPAPGAAFPEVAVFTVVMSEFSDLASWSAVMQWTCEFMGDSYGVLQ